MGYNLILFAQKDYLIEKKHRIDMFHFNSSTFDHVTLS